MMNNKNHWDCRIGIITMQKSQAGSNPILRLGDSISEEMWMGMPTNPNDFFGNNARVINAGFMGIKNNDLPDYRDYVLSLINPWCVSFQIGTNDSISSTPFILADWVSEFDAHLTAISNTSSVSKIIVKSIPPVLNADCGYDQSRINQMNLCIESLCDNYPKAVFLNLDPYLKCASTGYARPGYLADSVHLSGKGAWAVAWLEYCLCNNQELSPLPAAC